MVVTDKPIQKIFNSQLDIGLRQFSEEELDAGIKKDKNRKTASFDEIPPEERKIREFDDVLLSCNTLYKQNSI